MKQLSRLFILLLMVILLCLKIHGQTIHRSFDPRFRIEIPKDWTISNPKGPNTKLVINDKTGSSINIVVHKDNLYINIDSYDITLADLTKDLNQMPDFSVLSFQKTFINSKKAVCLKSQYRWQNLNVNTILVSLLYVIIHNDKMYYITCTAEQLNFPKYEVLFTSILSTFVIEEDFYNTQSASNFKDSRYKSLEDNFIVDFKSLPNIDSEANMTTYSVTSIRDTAIYRITVHTNNTNISNSTKRKEFETQFLNEYKKSLKESEIVSETTTFKNINAVLYRMKVLVYGEYLFLGEKAYSKSLVFINSNKIYTISVMSKETLNQPLKNSDMITKTN